MFIWSKENEKLVSKQIFHKHTKSADLVEYSSIECIIFPVFIILLEEHNKS